MSSGDWESEFFGRLLGVGESGSSEALRFTSNVCQSRGVMCSLGLTHSDPLLILSQRCSAASSDVVDLKSKIASASC